MTGATGGLSTRVLALAGKLPVAPKVSTQHGWGTPLLPLFFDNSISKLAPWLRAHAIHLDYVLPSLSMQHSPQKYKSTYDPAGGRKSLAEKGFKMSATR